MRGCEGRGIGDEGLCFFEWLACIFHTFCDEQIKKGCKGNAYRPLCKDFADVKS